jgi:mRNA interferase MazF
VRGEIYDARLDPVEGSEQGGVRPVVVISRAALNSVRSTIIVVPFTSARPERRIYPSRVLVRAPEGGLTVDSIALIEQIRTISKTRLLTHRGQLSHGSLLRIERALQLTLDLPRFQDELTRGR